EGLHLERRGLAGEATEPVAHGLRRPSAEAGREDLLDTEVAAQAQRRDELTVSRSERRAPSRPRLGFPFLNHFLDVCLHRLLHGPGTSAIRLLRLLPGLSSPTPLPGMSFPGVP